MNRRIYFSAGGRAPGDSALAVALELSGTAGYRLTWLGGGTAENRLTPQVPDLIHLAAPGRARRALHSLWASAIVTTHGLPVRRLGCLSVQLWHGVPVKRMGRSNLGAGQPRPTTTFDLVVCPSQFYLDNLIRPAGFHGQLLWAQLPRYSLLDRVDREANRALLARSVGDRRPILYAPTYRAGHDGLPDVTAQLAAALLAAAPEELAVIPRLHYLTAAPGRSGRWPGGAGTAEPGLRSVDQEDALLLLDATDGLITDYSSLLFDAAFLDKPTVLLAPDLDGYQRAPGLYLPLAELAGECFASSPGQALEVMVAQLARGGMHPPLRDALRQAAGWDPSSWRNGASAVAQAVAARL